MQSLEVSFSSSLLHAAPSLAMPPCTWLYFRLGASVPWLWHVVIYPTYRKGGGAAADASTRLQQAFSLFEARGVNERDEKSTRLGKYSDAACFLLQEPCWTRVWRRSGRTPDRAVRCSAAYSMRAAAATASTVRATASTPSAVLAWIKKIK